MGERSQAQPGGTVVVVPTVREQQIRAFLDAWREELAGADDILVLEDNPAPTFALETALPVTHLSWADIDRDLGDLAWIVPRRTDCVRSYGFWRAWRSQPAMIVTLDDDCRPLQPGFLAAHRDALDAPGADPAWESTTEPLRPRGFPYHEHTRRWRCVINHGLWRGIPDYDAVTQLAQQRTPTACRARQQTVPVGRYFPLCGMNVAFRPELTPALYFLLMGRSHGVDRFGDIWTGVFAKRICDHLGHAVRSGEPEIVHARASNVWTNLRKEAAGLERNETLWQIVDGAVLTETTVAGCYRQLADEIAAAPDRDDGLPPGYLRRLGQAMALWCDLFAGPVVPRPQSVPVTAPSPTGATAAGPARSRDRGADPARDRL